MAGPAVVVHDKTTGKTYGSPIIAAEMGVSQENLVSSPSQVNPGVQIDYTYQSPVGFGPQKGGLGVPEAERRAGPQGFEGPDLSQTQLSQLIGPAQPYVPANGSLEGYKGPVGGSVSMNAVGPLGPAMNYYQEPSLAQGTPDPSVENFAAYYGATGNLPSANSFNSSYLSELQNLDLDYLNSLTYNEITARPNPGNPNQQNILRIEDPSGNVVTQSLTPAQISYLKGREQKRISELQPLMEVASGGPGLQPPSGPFAGQPSGPFAVEGTVTNDVANSVYNSFSGPVRMGEVNGPSLGGGMFTPEFKQYAESLGYTVQRSIAADGGEYLVWTGQGQPPIPTSTTAENTVATTNTDVSQLPAYAPPQGPQQQIISGQPQSPQEVNVMDYQGVQAVSPVLQPQTQLAPQTQQIQITPEQLQQQIALGEAPQAVAPTPFAAQVAQPEVQPAVTAQVTEADLVDQPDLTKTSALQSIQKVNEEADAFKSAQLELGDVDPRATVQGQLALLQDQFAEGETPVWAQGAMRQANSLMAQRGLGSSSVAAEAITNALMQSAIPIAQQDASFYQTVSMQNLSNEQQTEMTKFNARLTSIFNDQAAENTARNINAASENDLAQFYANLSQNVVTTNASAYNAMEQFNSTAQNQMNQFAAELGLTADQINVDAVNEMAQFNAEQLSNVSQFNASMKNNREQFQVQNQIAIDASNVGWRRDVNTANTSATNAALQMDVQNLLGLQQNALNNIWDHYDTILNFAFKEEQSSLDRAAQLAIATMSAEIQQQIAEDKESTGLISSIFSAGATLLSSESGSVIGDFFGL